MISKNDNMFNLIHSKLKGNRSQKLLIDTIPYIYHKEYLTISSTRKKFVIYDNLFCFMDTRAAVHHVITFCITHNHSHKYMYT